MSTIITSPYGEQVYAQPQSALLTIPTVNGVAGPWQNSGAQYIRVTEDSLKMTPDEPKIPTNIKHGTASPLARIQGRKAGKWSLNVPIAPSGTVGVAPDVDPLLQSVFGGAGALVTTSPFGNAWEYNIYDQVCIPLFLAGFQKNNTITGNRYSMGSVTERMSIDFNANILSMSLDGSSVGVVEDETFSSVDALVRSNLSAFPSIPGSFSTRGQLINAFNATLTIGGQVFSNQCDGFSLEFQTGLSLKGDFIDSPYPVAVTYRPRQVSATINFVNNNSTALAQLKTWARTNAAVEVQLQLNQAAGYRVYITLQGVQFVPAGLTDSQGFVSVSFSQSTASVLPGYANDLAIGFA